MELPFDDMAEMMAEIRAWSRDRVADKFPSSGR
jgi:hypothetical protein